MGKKKNRGKQREESFDPENSNEGALPSRRKSKKDRLADPFFDEVVPDEDETPVHQSKPSKANKSKNAFEALNAESSEEDDDKEEESSSVKQKSSGNAFSAFALEEVDEDEESEIKQTTSNAFALLNDDDDDEDEEEEEEQLVKKKSKKKKKEKKGSIAMDNVFDELLQEESEIKVEVKSEELDEIPETGAKSKSKNKKKQNLFEAAFSELEQEGTSQDETPVVKPKKDKKKKKGKSTTFDDLLMEVKAEDNEERAAIEQSEKTKEDSIKQTEPPIPLLEEKELPAPPSKTKDKKKKKGRLTNFDDLLMEVEADDNDEDPVLIEKSEETKEDLTKQTEPSLSFSEEKELRAPVSKSRDKKKKKKGGAGGSKAKAEEDDIDALLAEIDGKKDPVSSSDKKQEVKTNEAPVSKAVVESQTTPSASEAITLEEENLAPPPVKTHVEPSIEASVEQEAEEEVTVHNEGQEELVPEVKLTAAQKKKQRKKDKKAREKEKQSASVSEDTKEKKIPAHVRKIQEQLEKKRLEEEKRRQEEEAEKQQLAEEERLRLEEEQRKEEEAKRKAEEKARREELKKEGKILTKKQKAEQARLSAVREQLLKSSGINIASGSAPRATVNPQEQKRIQREREEAKRKAEAERLQAEEEQRLIQQEQDRKRQEELEAQLKAEEELKRIEAAEAEIADNWEDITEDEESDHENEVDEEEALLEQADSTSSSSKSEVETASGWGSTTSSSSSEYTTDSEEEREKQIQAAKQKAEARIEEARAAASSENLRSPICCILGHVDTGKTKILDNIRKTNVQDNEAGGITQQIGATYIPSEALLTRTNELRKGREYEIKVPGLLVIDTPGHESFTNLRTRGSSLCDIAILVVDLMHGLEAQTLESIELLRQKKTPFIIALNKVDRINDWKVMPNAPIRESLNRQKKHTLLHYEDRLQACSTMLMERGLNVALYWKNKEPRKIVNMVPTSAITGEGICDMLQLLIKLTTSLMAEKLMFLSEVQCSVLEVKAIEGLGTTVDVVLVNGQLNEGDRIVVCGMTGPIVTTIRSLLTPHPLKELRVKGSYLHHKSIQAAQGIKICAQNLEQAVAGTALRVVREGEEEECKLLAIEEMEDVLSRIDKTGEGVSVQASTLGSLEALLEFLKTPEVQIPVSAIGIGPIHKKDVMRANVMNEKKIKKFAVILAFDVPVTKEARELSEELNVKIFTADIIYHLFDQFKAYVEEVRQAEKRAASTDAVFPCILEIIPTCIFNKKDPIVLGCEVLDGQARLGTPLVVPGKQGRSEVSLGKIESMELNHKAVERADRGDNVAIKIQSTNPEEAARLYGRHFDHTDQLYSRISRDSINALKAFFRDEMTTPDWNLVIKLKKIYQIE